MFTNHWRAAMAFLIGVLNRIIQSMVGWMVVKDQRNSLWFLSGCIGYSRDLMGFLFWAASYLFDCEVFSCGETPFSLLRQSESKYIVHHKSA